MERKYSDENINKRIEQSKMDTIRKLKEKNIQFELIGPYINKATKTKFKCLKCGEIREYIPHNILNNNCACTACGIKKKRTYEEFLDEVKKIDPEYIPISSKDELLAANSDKFIDTNKYCKFLHTVCGNITNIRSTRFLNKDSLRCSFCASNRKKTDDEIKEKIKEIYGDSFILEGHYNGRHNLMSLKCTKCGNITTDLGFNFVTNHRCCSYCNVPKSELLVKRVIPNIEKEIKFDGMEYKEQLKYDFQYNGIIFEIDGIQHFKSVDHFGGDERLTIQRARDAIKNEYAIKNNLKLIRIFNEEIDTEEKVNKIVNFSSTTIENMDNSFSNILIISDGKILLRKGMYSEMLVEYTQASGNGDAKDIV